MSHVEVRIADARAAASALVAFGKLSGRAGIPADQSELEARLSRATGRARPLAVALSHFIETHGFEALQLQLSCRVPVGAERTSFTRGDAEAAASANAIKFEALDSAAMNFAASGLY